MFKTADGQYPRQTGMLFYIQRLEKGGYGLLELSPKDLIENRTMVIDEEPVNVSELYASESTAKEEIKKRLRKDINTLLMMLKGLERQEAPFMKESDKEPRDVIGDIPI